MKKKIICGLIRGRHEMPCETYIFNDAIENVFDFDGIEDHIIMWCEANEPKHLVVYVTGLTCVTAALIKVCNNTGITLTLMHFNSVSGEYEPQVILD